MIKETTHTPAIFGIGLARLLAALFLAGISGGMMFNAMPVYLGAAAVEFQLNDSQIGDMAASYILGFSFSSLFAVAFIRRLPWHPLMAVVLLISAGDYFLFSQVENLMVVFILQFVLGFCFAQIFGLLMCYFGDLAEVDRLFGLKAFAELVFAAVMMFTVPTYILGDWGFDGMLVLYGTVCLLGVLLIPLIPKGSLSRHEFHSDSEKRTVPLWGWAAIITLLVYFAAMTGVFPFIEIIGTEQGFRKEDLALVLSGATCVSMLGALTVAFIGDDYGRKWIFVGAGLLVVLSLYMLSEQVTFLSYAVAILLFNLGWNIVMPYAMGLVDELDNSGRLVVGITVALPAGAIIGPPVIGRMREAGDAALLYGMVGAVIIITTFSFVRLIYQAEIAIAIKED